jgi:hypothetical protein
MDQGYCQFLWGQSEKVMNGIRGKTPDTWLNDNTIVSEDCWEIELNENHTTHLKHNVGLTR